MDCPLRRPVSASRWMKYDVRLIFANKYFMCVVAMPSCWSQTPRYLYWVTDFSAKPVSRRGRSAATSGGAWKSVFHR